MSSLFPKSYLSASVRVVSYPTKPRPYEAHPPLIASITPPEPPLSVNRTNGKHWGTYAAHRSAWHESGRLIAEQLADTYEDVIHYLQGQRLHITYGIPLTRPSAADEANYLSGISIKAFQDGIVEAGTLLPDDNTTWLRSTCQLYKGKLVVVRVQPAPADVSPLMWLDAA